MSVNVRAADSETESDLSDVIEVVNDSEIEIDSVMPLVIVSERVAVSDTVSE